GRKIEIERRQHYLKRPTFVFLEDRSQRFVPRHNLIQAPRQSRAIEVARELHSDGKIIRGTQPLLLEKPKPPLRGRERQEGRTAGCSQRRNGGGLAGSLRNRDAFFNLLREVGDARSADKCLERQVYADPGREAVPEFCACQ